MENSEIGLTCKKRQNEITYWWIFFVFDKSGIYCDLSLYSRTVKKGTIKYTCFHFLPYLLQPDTFTRSVLMWKKENLFAFMGKAYYFRYSAFAMVNTYFLAQWEQIFSNVSFVFLLGTLFYSWTNNVKSFFNWKQGRSQFKKSINGRCVYNAKNGIKMFLPKQIVKAMDTIS